MPKVAITFDDGPNAHTTPRVLDILNEAGVGATFFLLGREIVKCPRIVSRMADAGHEIGVHGFDHKTTNIRAQFLACRRELNKLGVTTSLFRFPAGAMTLTDLLWVARHGCSTVLWSFDARDSMRDEGKWDGPVPDYREVRAGDVILMHDDNPVCVAELPGLIETVRGNGLEPVTVSKLIG